MEKGVIINKGKDGRIIVSIPYNSEYISRLKKIILIFNINKIIQKEWEIILLNIM